MLFYAQLLLFSMWGRKLSCVIFYSDKPGNHDFKILKKLVLPGADISFLKFHPITSKIIVPPMIFVAST
jgi:hypothetical protein